MNHAFSGQIKLGKPINKMGFYKTGNGSEMEMDRKWKQLPNKGETDQKMFLVFAKTGKDQKYWESLEIS